MSTSELGAKCGNHKKYNIFVKFLVIRGDLTLQKPISGEAHAVHNSMYHFQKMPSSKTRTTQEQPRVHQLPSLIEPRPLHPQVDDDEMVVDD